MSLPRIAFTHADAVAANDAWRFNAGPAALCAVAGITPDELRPHLPGFSGMMSTTNMRNALDRLGLLVLSYRYVRPDCPAPWPPFGLVRLQWHGPWMLSNAPIAAREQHTHWVAALGDMRGRLLVFDATALHIEGTSGWIPAEDWAELIVPRILEQHPGADDWSVSHSFEMQLEPGDLIRARRLDS